MCQFPEISRKSEPQLHNTGRNLTQFDKINMTEFYIKTKPDIKILFCRDGFYGKLSNVNGFTIIY